eukprot:TRINITY_DN3062_c1_g1_i1.p1 TRINITY_DN3062_c1_g1~~TRINITY_DN3062_c1_g1_i1.p1  ORF type:complete len:934 (-),score=124.28 TRINITY_DN3062_c1_g1_i1:564-3365(-)
MTWKCDTRTVRSGHSKKQGEMARTLLVFLVMLVSIANAQIPEYFCNNTAGTHFYTIFDSEAYISSNAGRYYQNDMVCVWFLRPSVQASSLTILFDKLDTEYMYDPVVIWDGIERASQLTWFSGRSVPTDAIYTPSGTATIQFYANQFQNGGGFRLSVHANVCPSFCNGHGKCLGSTCHCDAGWNGTACEIPMCPGNCLPHGTCDTARNMCVCEEGYYGGDCNSVYCDGNSKYFSENGSFVDHHGGGEYRNNERCEWLIVPSNWHKGDSVSLTFTKFDMERNYDYVYVYDGNSTNDLLVGQFSGTTLPPRMLSKSGKLLVVFTTDLGITRTGFAASWKVESCECSEHGYCHHTGECICDIGYTGNLCEERECFHNCWGNGNCTNGTTCDCDEGWGNIDCGICTGEECNTEYCLGEEMLYDNEGAFADHSGSGDSMPDSDCEWGIYAEQKGISLQFTAVDFSSEVVTIFDGEPEDGRVIGVLEGIYDDISEIPTFYSTGRDGLITVHYQSGNSTRTGFSASYTTYQCPQQCEHGSCFGGVCSCDYGYKGLTCNQTYCVNNCSGFGTCVLDACQCQTGHFGPDCLTTYCEGSKVLTATSGLITDRSEGSEYLPGSSCSWFITTPGGGNGQPMTIAFDKFQTEATYDLVEIYDGSTDGILLANYSGAYNPDPVIVPSGIVDVRFMSDAFGNFDGFTASFTSNSLCLNGCSGLGFCIKGECACPSRFSGEDCSKAQTGSANWTIEDGSLVVQRDVGTFKWQVYYVDVPEGIDWISFKSMKVSTYGHPEFYVNPGRIPTIGEHYNFSAFWNSETPMRFENPISDRWYIAVYGRQEATFRIEVIMRCPSDTYQYGDECLPSESSTSEVTSEPSTSEDTRSRGIIIALLSIAGVALVVAAIATVGIILYRRRAKRVTEAVEMPSVVKSKSGSRFTELEDED